MHAILNSTQHYQKTKHWLAKQLFFISKPNNATQGAHQQRRRKKEAKKKKEANEAEEAQKIPD